MKNKLGSRLNLILFTLILTFPSCTVISPPGKKSGNKKFLNRVLIVSEKNRSKDPVFSKGIFLFGMKRLAGSHILGSFLNSLLYLLKVSLFLLVEVNIVFYILGMRHRRRNIV